VTYAYDSNPKRSRRTTCDPQEEGEYEWASDQHSGAGGEEEARLEPAVLIQPLGGEEAGGEGATLLGYTVPLCKAGSEGPCARDAKGGPGGFAGARPGKRDVTR
jgi:hypothetical protein